jgi:hypothetical protein
MPSGVLLFRLLPVIAATALSAVTLTAAAGPTSGGAERLPDLDQEVPDELEITVAGSSAQPVYRLGFRSAVRNVGRGPLLISGHRSSADAATMTASQVIQREKGPQAVVPGVGTLRYTISPDHRHWHLLRFDRYSLRRAGSPGAATISDRKTGFCLGDRYRVVDRKLRTAPAEPVHTSRCGLELPGLSEIQEGISVGYGDDYDATLEGQYLPLTGLRSGRYVLVHRVNGNRRLRELRYGNNAASLLLELRWRKRQPRVRVLRACPNSDRCDSPLPRRRG